LWTKYRHLMHIILVERVPQRRAGP
jgi:hypothetical protein